MLKVFKFYFWGIITGVKKITQEAKRSGSLRSKCRFGRRSKNYVSDIHPSEDGWCLNIQKWPLIKSLSARYLSL